MRRPSPLVNQRSIGTDLDSAMTPMIDVVFLLLVFFVWTASFQIVEQILPSELSAQMGSEPAEVTEPTPESDYDEVVVKIGWDGTQPNWSLNDEAVGDIGALIERLTIISNVRSDKPVILDPEDQVPLGFVIEAYDASKVAGFSKVSFAVDPSQG